MVDKGAGYGNNDNNKKRQLTVAVIVDNENGLCAQFADKDGLHLTASNKIDHLEIKRTRRLQITHRFEKI
uniref:Uncharacterized protein n=1 Tax=Romanomermis culicivorax TaxID=13658 RepID=A0A915HPL2_ROMCU